MQEDFGIFSDAYLYLGNERNRDKIAGIFSRDSDRILKYIACYDALWNSTTGAPVSRYVEASVSRDQLFDPSFVVAKKTQPAPEIKI